MKLAPWALAVACAASAVFVAVWHLSSPRVETVTVTKVAPTPKRPTLAQFKRLLKPVEFIEETDALMLGVPMTCRYADSTFDPDAQDGVRWVAQYCWELEQTR